MISFSLTKNFLHIVKYLIFICRCRLAVPDLQDIIYDKLNVPPDSGNVCQIVGRLSLNDKIDICQQLHLCIPGIYPLVFNKKSSGNVKKILGEEHSMTHLLQYLQSKPQIILPKHIVLKDFHNGSDIYLGPDDLLPGTLNLQRNNLVCVERESVFILAKKEAQHKYLENTVGIIKIRQVQSNWTLGVGIKFVGTK